ncbi:hypothetical protein BpHYR1_032835 [Brachionus plicatilis]|uniref:Uncharacterized protein n=1 Tax=Brachionus plicatilis TaxID=10195 RepID=A0A3M7QN76_BRAPC|nr:hypothetical protein BpHYR1_032835 [Brachionus plicatilis]
MIVAVAVAVVVEFVEFVEFVECIICSSLLSRGRSLTLVLFVFGDTFHLVSVQFWLFAQIVFVAVLVAFGAGDCVIVVVGGGKRVLFERNLEPGQAGVLGAVGCGGAVRLVTALARLMLTALFFDGLGPAALPLFAALATHRLVGRVGQLVVRLFVHFHPFH